MDQEEMISELKPWMLKNNCEDDCPYYQAQYIYPSIGHDSGRV